MTEEKIRQAIVNMQEVLREYGSIFPPEVPVEIYTDKIEPFYPLLKAIVSVLTPDGVYLDIM